MATRERSRDEFGQRLGEVLGPDYAAKLMSYLPDVPVSELVRRTDLASFDERLQARFERIDHRFERIDHRFERIDERFERIDERFSDFDRRLGDLSDSVDVRLEGMEHRILGTFYRELNAQTRLLFFAMIGSVFTAASLAFAANLL